MTDTQKSSSTTRWVGIAFLIIFFVLGGASVCTWYMWIVFGLLCLVVIGGESKGIQAVLGIALLIWGTPLIKGEPQESDNYEYSTSSSASNDVKQSDKEKKQIDDLIHQAEILHAEFERADRAGRPMSELKRISDQGWEIHNRLIEMNLTKEQRQKVSELFAL